MRTFAAALVALGLALTACLGSTSTATPGSQVTSPSTTSTTSTTSSTSTTVSLPTTTTLPPPPTSILNGLEVADAAALERRILAVKIDNHSRARPQSGIEGADMMIELMVESITRFISIWHESDSEYLGPVRSGRPTDATLLQALNEPTFAISGAQDWVYDVFSSRDVRLIGQNFDGLFRISSRSAPHNLYADTVRLRENADRLGYPDLPPDGPIWEFGPMSDFAPPASAVRINFDGNVVNWEWDAESGLWLRSTGSTSSMWRTREGETGRIAVPVLVALYVEQYTASPPGGGSPVPASRTVGSGKAFVFANGQATEGTWRRGAESEWFLLTDGQGEIILVPPGKVWLSLVPDHTGLTYQG